MICDTICLFALFLWNYKGGFDTMSKMLELHNILQRRGDSNDRIDFGSTSSLVCIWEEDYTRLLENSFWEKLTPSVVSFDEDGTVYVGKTARELPPDRAKRIAALKKRMETIYGTDYRNFARDWRQAFAADHLYRQGTSTL